MEVTRKWYTIWIGYKYGGTDEQWEQYCTGIGDIITKIERGVLKEQCEGERSQERLKLWQQQTRCGQSDVARRVLPPS